MAVPLIPSRQRNIVFFNELKGRAAGVPLPTRKIDLVDGLRDRPMKILCLGYSRTGTVSLFTALTMLGYKPYHMAVAVQNASVELPCWADGLEAKRLGKGEPWGKEEFDKILGRYDAVLDVPAILFAEELITAYPDAKVILTERPVKDWLKSMRGSVGEAYSWQRWKYVAWADKDIAAPLYQLVGQTLYHIWNKNDFRENSKTQQDYLDHYKLIRRVSSWKAA